jgi:hypothetical protein
MMITAFAIVGLLAPQADKWEIKAPYTKDTKLQYALNVDVDMNGETHGARFTMSQSFGDKASDLTDARIQWFGIDVDDNPQDDLPAWEIKLNAQGAVMSLGSSLEDDYRRMLTPFLFVFPDKAVSVGDKWELKAGPKDALSLTFESKGVEKVMDFDAMKIEEKFKESAGSMVGTGTWWISKTGKPLKFEMKVTDWVAPFTGNTAPISATIKGTLKQ